MKQAHKHQSLGRFDDEFATADATAIVFCINLPLALIALLAVLALIDQEITLVFQWEQSVSIHSFKSSS